MSGAYGEAHCHASAPESPSDALLIGMTGRGSAGFYAGTRGAPRTSRPASAGGARTVGPLGGPVPGGGLAVRTRVVGGVL